MKIQLNQYQNRHGSKNKLRRFAWEIVWALLFRTTPRWCLNGWRCFLLRLFGAKIGARVKINGSAKVWQPWKLSIGNDSWIDGDVSLYSVDQINIGANVVVSNGAYICTASHDITSNVFELITKPITINDGAWVCAKATVLPGVDVGEGAVVALGAVATKSVRPWVVVGGNPAKEIGIRSIK